MNITTRNRAELKSYFVKNAIPTENNFAELIEGMLNQSADGVVKLPGDPLSIEAVGDEDSPMKALNLYRNLSDPNPDWSISLNPGFNLCDGENNSRLFIDRNNGNIGIGTAAPDNRLEVNGAIEIQVEDADCRLRFHNPGKNWYSMGIDHSDEGKFKINSGPDLGYNEFFTMDYSGNVGIGTATPGAKLEIAGNLRITGADNQLWFPTSDVREFIRFGSWDRYAIGVQGATHYFRTGKNFAWYQGGTHHDGQLNPGGGTVQMVINDGNVGIGTASIHNPQGWNKTVDVLGQNHARFNVRSSDVITSVFSHNNWGGARGVIGTESNHPLTFATNYTHRMTILPDGKVGIGTPSPAGTLEVKGLGAINDGNGYAVKNNFMSSGSLTIGSITQNYGGGSGWTKSTAGLLLETKKNTEIAVHDSMNRVASLMYYQGDGTNSITIGRDMGWGAISSINLNGTVHARGFNTHLYTARGDHSINISSANRWADFPDLSQSISINAKTNVLVFYQISMPGSDSHICTRLIVDGKEMKGGRSICGNVTYWTASGFWIGNLSAGSHTIKVQYRTPKGGNNNPGHDWQNRVLKVLVLGS